MRQWNNTRARRACCALSIRRRGAGAPRDGLSNAVRSQHFGAAREERNELEALETIAMEPALFLLILSTVLAETKVSEKNKGECDDIEFCRAKGDSPNYRPKDIQEFTTPKNLQKLKMYHV